MQDGQQVVVFGSISTYERDGTYQLYAREIVLDGAGLLTQRFQELKEELENNMYPVDLAELMKDFTQKQLVMVFRLLAKEEAAETFAEMDSDMREMLIGGLTDSELEEVMEEMYLMIRWMCWKRCLPMW